MITHSERNTDNFSDSNIILSDGTVKNGRILEIISNNTSDSEQKAQSMYFSSLTMWNGTYEWNQTESAYKFKQ